MSENQGSDEQAQKESESSSSSATPPSSSERQGESSRKEFRVEGVVREVLPEKNKVRIAHEEIPDYMPAMTMVFEVKQAAELEGLQAGDKVRFLMVVTHDDGWIEEVQKLGEVSELVADAPNTFRPVRDVDPLEVGDVMPDYTFTNEVGEVVQLSDYRGKVLAMTFIFTRCPFPTFCPRMSSYFQAVYKELMAQENGPDNWHLFSVTIDPEYDTAEVLKTYAQGYTYDPERWNYLTGKLIDITAITEQFGLQFYRPDPDNPANLSHNLRTAVIDPSGKVSAILVGNEWKAEDLARAIQRAASASE